MSAAFVTIVCRSGHTARKGGKEQSGTCAAKRERIRAELHTGDRQNCRRPTGGRMRPRRADVTPCGTPSAMSADVGPGETNFERSRGSTAIMAEAARHHTAKRRNNRGARAGHVPPVKRGSPYWRLLPQRAGKGWNLRWLAGDTYTIRK